MATIRQTLSLTDGMSGPLKSMNKALRTVLNSFEAMQSASSQSIDTEAIQAARRELDSVDSYFRRIEEDMERTRRAQDRLNDEIHEGKTEARGLMGTIGTLAAALGAAKLASAGVSLLRDGIEYASDLAEVQNVVDVTFTNSAESINAWAKTALDAYGMNEVSAKRYAGSLGAMMKSSGLAEDSVADMSMAMVGLAGDMASFYNLDLDTAFEKIRSGISGETEPLKQLDINMSVANLEAYALSQGVEKSYQEMTQAEQVMLRYNYLLNATADAQGDFARTQDSWANQTRLLSENWLQFRGVLAENLLPVLTLVVTMLNRLVMFAQEHSAAITAALTGIAVGVGILTGAFVVHTIATRLLTEANKKLILSLLASPFTWIAVGISVVIALISRWVQSVGGIHNAWEIAKKGIQTAWAAIKYAFFSGVYFCMDLVQTLRVAWKQGTTEVANAAGDLKVRVLTTLQDMLNKAVGMLNDFIGLLNNIPGVSIDAIASFSFGTRAALENEANKQLRNQSLADAQNQLNADIAQREATLAGLKAEMSESAAATKDLYNTYKNAAAVGGGTAASSGIGDASSSALGAGSDLKNLIGNTADTAENTGKLVTNTSKSSEELKLLREIAERQAINQFTTAEIKVEMNNNNSISSDMDIDGIVRQLEKSVEESMYAAAEGVHV